MFSKYGTNQEIASALKKESDLYDELEEVGTAKLLSEAARAIENLIDHNQTLEKDCERFQRVLKNHNINVREV